MDFYNYYKQPLLNYTSNIGVIMTGLVYGFNSTILPGVDAIRQSFNLDKIKFFISTWDIDENLKWLDQIVLESKKYPSIELDININSLSDIGIDKIWENIYTNVDIDYNLPINVDFNSYKRLIPIVAAQLGYNYAYSSTPQDSSVYKGNQYPLIRLKPNSLLNSPQFIKDNFIPRLQDDIDTYLQMYLKDVHGNQMNPYDNIYCSHPVGSVGFGDHTYISNPSTILKIVGDSLETTVDRFIEILKEYKDQYWKSIKNTDDFKVFSRDINSFPLEGSSIFKKYTDLSSETISYCSSYGVSNIVKYIYNINNPWYYIDRGSIKKLTELELYNLDNQHYKYLKPEI